MALSNIKREKLKVTTLTFYEYLLHWDKDNKWAYDGCESIGSDYCFLLKYEDLVTTPEKKIRETLDFLDIPFSTDFLRHNEHGKYTAINETFAAVRKEINSEMLNSWYGKIKYDKHFVKAKVKMLTILGYKIDFTSIMDGKFTNITIN